MKKSRKQEKHVVCKSCFKTHTYTYQTQLSLHIDDAVHTEISVFIVHALLIRIALFEQLASDFYFRFGFALTLTRIFLSFFCVCFGDANNINNGCIMLTSQLKTKHLKDLRAFRRLVLLLGNAKECVSERERTWQSNRNYAARCVHSILKRKTSGGRASHKTHRREIMRKLNTY